MSRAPLALALVVIGCATVQTRRPTITVAITNLHWYANAVRFECQDGSPSFVVRGLVTGQRIRVRKPAGCREYAVAIEGVGLKWWYRFRVQANEGDTLCVDIGPSVRLTSVWTCTERTE